MFPYLRQSHPGSRGRFNSPFPLAVPKAMDDTDRKLLLLISSEPRMHSRELAKKLGISRQTVQQRMQVLTRGGALNGVSAVPSTHYLDGVHVSIFGRSNTASIQGTLRKLGESEFTRSVIVAGGNSLYVSGVLRNVTELDTYAEFVKRTAEMPAPTVGISSFDDDIMPPTPADGGRRRQSYRELTPLDFEIIASLKGDARRPVADIAHALGVTAKTVRRHLEDMMSEGSLEFDVPWDMMPGEDMVTLMQVNLKEGADKGEVGRRLLAKCSSPNFFVRSWCNLPSFLLCTLCSDKMTEIRKVLGVIGKDEAVLAVTPNLLYVERIYSTWRDRLHETPGRSSKKAGTRKLRSGVRRR